MIKNIGLAGGGFYGIAHVAVLEELEKYNVKPEKIRGVSVGSMVAALYAVGYNSKEMKKVLFETDFDALIKDNYFAYYMLYEKYGMYTASALEDKIEQLISQKTLIKNCTFNQIKMDLSIISTNLNYQRAQFFDKDNTPNMSISHAVRMSIGYPGMIVPILYDNDYYGDGGEFINYPISTFEDIDNTLGITFSAHNENRDGTLKERIKINNIFDYVAAITSTISRSAYTSQITDRYLSRSVVVHITNNISSMQFDLSAEQKRYIYECGTKAAQEQLPDLMNAHKCRSSCS